MKQVLWYKTSSRWVFLFFFIFVFIFIFILLQLPCVALALSAEHGPTHPALPNVLWQALLTLSTPMRAGQVSPALVMATILDSWMLSRSPHSSAVISDSDRCWIGWLIPCIGLLGLYVRDILVQQVAITISPFAATKVAEFSAATTAARFYQSSPRGYEARSTYVI